MGGIQQYGDLTPPEKTITSSELGAATSTSASTSTEPRRPTSLLSYLIRSPPPPSYSPKPSHLFLSPITPHLHPSPPLPPSSPTFSRSSSPRNRQPNNPISNPISNLYLHTSTPPSTRSISHFQLTITAEFTYRTNRTNTHSRLSLSFTDSYVIMTYAAYAAYGTY